MADRGLSDFDTVLSQRPTVATGAPIVTSLLAALLAVTGRPALPAPPISTDELPSAIDAALTLAGSALPALPAPAANLSIERQLATTRRLIAEVEIELERLRAEAEELERQLGERTPSGDEQLPPAASPANDIVVETPGPGHFFSAIFRRTDPNRPARQYRGYVEITVQSPASPSAVRELERALVRLPDLSIRLVWGAPQRGTTFGVDLRQPLPLAEQVKQLAFVQSVQELGDRGGVGRLRVRMREP